MRQPLRQFIDAGIAESSLVIMCGLPASCKTPISQQVSAVRGFPLVRSDLIRRELLRDEDIFDRNVASDMAKRLTVYDETLRQAEAAIVESGNAVIDATFITQALRRRAASIAAKHNKSLIIVQTQRPRNVSIAAILSRTKEEYESNAVTEEAYVNNERQFQPVDLDDLKSLHPDLSLSHVIVDTEHTSPDHWFVTGIEKR
ncbi:MAG: AAA family ATPase [Chloroflexi bacterium]|nr:AAA family ATPase [Chloroflexota bacterium]